MMKKMHLNRIKLIKDVFFECLKSIKYLFILHLLCKLLIATLPLLNINLFSAILNLFLKNPVNINRVFVLTILFISAIFIGQVAEMLNNLVEAKINLKITQNNHIQFNNIITAFPLSYIDSPKGKNDIQLLLTSYEFYSNIYHGIISVINCLYIFLASFYVLAKHNNWYALFTIMLVLPVIIFSYKNQKDDDDFEAKQMPIRATKDNYLNMLTSARYSMDVRLYDVQGIFINKYLELAKKIYNLYKFKYKQRLCLGLIFQSIMILGQIVLMCHLVLETYFKTISVAELSKILGYVFSAISTMITCGIVITDVITKLLWIEEYSIAKHNNKISYSYSDGINLTNIQSIEFDDVWFRYPGTTFDVLKGVSFKINMGERISFVGVNGAGKTTCVKLLLGIYQPNQGKILINNVSLDQYDEKKLHNMFSCVFQNFIIYPFSLKENIMFGLFDDDGANNKLSYSLKASGCSRFVNNLKDGLDTFLSRRYSSNGAELSKGQKQSVVIARAMQKKAPVMIFDEPSSALDAENEHELLKVFDGLKQEQIGILISHRLSSTTVSDRILLIDDGIIKENGNHRELMNLGGIYCQMYLKQKQQYGRA